MNETRWWIQILELKESAIYLYTLPRNKATARPNPCVHQYLLSLVISHREHNLCQHSQRKISTSAVFYHHDTVSILCFCISDSLLLISMAGIRRSFLTSLILTLVTTPNRPNLSKWKLKSYHTKARNFISQYIWALYFPTLTILRADYPEPPFTENPNPQTPLLIYHTNQPYPSPMPNVPQILLIPRRSTSPKPITQKALSPNLTIFQSATAEVSHPHISRIRKGIHESFV